RHSSRSHPGGAPPPSLSKSIDVSFDAYRLETDGLVSTQRAPIRDAHTESYHPAGQLQRGPFHFLSPSAAVNILPGRPTLSIGPINPVSPTRTARFLDYF